MNRLRYVLPSTTLLLLMMMSGAASAQSLADLARQEEIRRRAIRIPGRVYTDADLKRSLRETNRVAAPTDESIAVAPVVASTPAVHVATVPETRPALEPVAPPVVGASVAVSMHVVPAPVADRTPVLVPGPAAALAEDVRPAAPPVASAVQREQASITVVAPVERVAASFTTSGTGTAAAAAPAWATFTLAKSAEERAIERRQLQNADPGFVRLPRPVLPPSRETLKTTAAIGYVQGADWGAELSAIGTYRGLRTDGRAFITSGPAGLEWYNGWFMLENPDTWRLAAGDLSTDLRGATRGVRMSWAGGGRRSPAVSLFMPDTRLGYDRPAVSYRDAVDLGRGMRVGGEVSSDGGAFVHSGYSQSRVGFETSFRRATGRYAGRDWGWTAAYDLWRGLGVRGGAQYSVTTDGRGEGYTVGGQIPIPGRIALSIDHTASRLNDAAHGGQSATVQFSVGRVRLLQRYARGTFTTLVAGQPAIAERQQLQTTTAFAPVRWANIQLQVANQWQPDGRLVQWQELASSFLIGQRTQMQAVMALPHVLDPSRLRLRLSQALSPDFNLEVEYGRLGAFQSITRFDQERARFRVMIRKSWDVATPAGGGLVNGKVTDALGSPVAGAPIRLGPYRVATDETGAYAFPHVPSGKYDLTLDASQLPAAYISAERPRQIMTKRGSESSEDFFLIALDTVRGYVYEDRNGNGKPDEGEGVARVAVRLGAHVTATDQHGVYAFFNVPPGRHEVSVHPERLPAGYTLVSSSTQHVELVTGQSTRPTEFHLKRVERPIIFQQ